MRRLLGVAFGLALAASAGAQNHTRSMTNATSRMDGGPILSSGGVTGGTCTNQVVTALDTAGLPTCASISAAMIPNATITLANFANAVANSKLLGSGAAGAGASYSEITLGSGLSMVGTTLSSTGGGVADPGGNGIMARTALNTSINRTIVCAAAYCSWANGDGVAGAPSLTLSLAAANDGGAIVKQASAPGTVQSTAFWNIDGLATVTKANILAVVTDAFFASNPTAADAVNTQQLAPAFKTCGSAWNSSGAASELDCWRILAVPNTIAGTTTDTLRFDVSINGGAYSTGKITLSSAGAFATSGGITSGSNVTALGSSRLLFSAQGGISSASDGVFAFENQASTSSASVVTMGGTVIQATQGAKITYGYTMESLTIAAAATTDSVGSILPANSVIDSVTVRVTTVIPTAATFTVGDATTPGRFIDGTNVAAVTVAANSTGIGLNHLNPAAATFAAGSAQVAAAKVRITPNLTPGAATGVVRITVFWHTFTAPTS